MMDIKGKIGALAETVASEYGFEVFDVEVSGNMRRPLVRIFIDKDGGVTLEDCERFSRAMSAALDVEDPIPSSYTLEVSSPGMDRPLKRLKDFQGSVGKRARLILTEPIEGQTFFAGRIGSVQDDVILLQVEKEREVRVPFGNIAKARLEIEI